MTGAEVLVIGLDPQRVPGPWDPAPVGARIETGRRKFLDHKVSAHYCLVGLDGSDDVPATMQAALTARPWTVVVVGGGLRADDQLALLELTINLIRQHAPTATITFNETPETCYEAALRGMAGWTNDGSINDGRVTS